MLAEGNDFIRLKRGSGVRRDKYLRYPITLLLLKTRLRPTFKGSPEVPNRVKVPCLAKRRWSVRDKLDKLEKETS